MPKPKKPTQAEKLRIQVGKYLDDLVTGYAQQTHCNQRQAEFEVRMAVEDVIKQM